MSCAGVCVDDVQRCMGMCKGSRCPVRGCAGMCKGCVGMRRGVRLSKGCVGMQSCVWVCAKGVWVCAKGVRRCAGVCRGVPHQHTVILLLGFFTFLWGENVCAGAERCPADC